MSKEVKVPQISEDADKGTVADIYVKEGDTIEEGQDIIGLESDKASVDVPSDAAGKVKSIEVSEGDEVSVGDVILILEEGDGSDEADSDEDDEKDEEDSEKEEKSEKDSEDEEEDGSDEDEDGSDDKEKPDEDDDSDEDEKKSEREGEGSDEDEEDSDEKKKKDKDSEDADEDSDEEDEEKKKSSEEDEDVDEEEESDSDEEEDEEADEDEDDPDEERDSEKDKKKDSKKDKGSKGKEKGESKKEESDEDEDDGSPTAPLAKKFARELGIDIGKLQGGDPEKRITRDDVMAYAKKIISKKGEGSATGGGIEPIELPDFSQWGETEREPLSGIRSAVAKTVTTSWQNIAHVTHHDQADLTELNEFLEKTAEEDGEKLSMTAVLTKIAVEALKRFPRFNASLDMANKEIILKKYYNISVAVDTENGLMMPVLKDVDQKPLAELSKELGELAEKARNQKLKPEEMKGGNFAISNLGGIGGTSFTPVIFPPQAAILGVSTSQTTAVHKDGKFEPREILPLSLSYDHRLIDGADAARFLRWICEVIEQPFNLLTRG